MTLDGLITRLELATGPDRELADDVLVEVCGWVRGERDNGFGPIQTINSPDGKVCVVCQHDNRPNPLASIDAALTLVPEGWTWNIHHGFAIDAELMFARRGALALPDIEVSVHDAVSAPLALCIASLRARNVK